MMAVRYLSDEILSGFDKYKYCSVDTSPLSKYVTHPFWNWVVEYVPTYIAPNTLTLSGFLFIILQFCVLSYYDYDFYSSADQYPDYPAIPQIIWLLSALCIFLAHTLDGIDGKQARRTKTSGPLGELFDHGLDSWAALFMPLGIYSVLGRGEFGVDPLNALYVIMFVTVTFIAAHWEKYNTGVLFLPWGYDLSQITMVVLYSIVYFGDYHILKFTLPIVDVKSGKFFETCMYVAVFAFSIPMSIWNVYKSYADKSGHMYGPYECLRPLFSTAVLCLAVVWWAKSSSCNIVAKEPRLFLLAFGTVFSNCACRLIVSCMSNTRCTLFNWLLLPLVFIVVGVNTLYLGSLEIYLLYAYTMFALAAHIHYGICVVQQLSDHFNIYVFSTLKPPSPEKNHK